MARIEIKDQWSSKARARGIRAFRNMLHALVRHVEPRKWPDKEPEDILRDAGWDARLIATLHGRRACLWIEIQKVKRAMWEAIVPNDQAEARL